MCGKERTEMMTIKTGIAVLAAMALGGRAWAGLDSADDARQQLRLEIILADGSCVIGVPSIQSVRVQTPYANVNVPLKRILTINVRDDHETASFDLQNGDKLTGLITLEPIRLETVFGAVAIGIEQVRDIRVMASGGVLPESVKERLILHYTFDREEGGKVTDRSGKGNNGQMSNAKGTPEGKAGWACEFDGQAAVVNAGHDPSLDITRDLTISMWVYPRKKTFGDQLQVLVGKDDGSDDTGRSYLVYLVGGTLYFAYGKGPGNGFHNVTASGELVFEKWHHVVAVHKTGAGNSLYADGELVAKDSQGSSLPSNPDMDVLVGDSKAWEPWYFYGALDDVMLFDTAMSESDIRRIYSSHE